MRTHSILLSHGAGKTHDGAPKATAVAGTPPLLSSTARARRGGGSVRAPRDLRARREQEAHAAMTNHLVKYWHKTPAVRAVLRQGSARAGRALQDWLPPSVRTKGSFVALFCNVVL